MDKYIFLLEIRFSRLKALSRCLLLHLKRVIEGRVVLNNQIKTCNDCNRSHEPHKYDRQISLNWETIFYLLLNKQRKNRAQFFQNLWQHTNVDKTSE